jgi:transketolase
MSKYKKVHAGPNSQFGGAKLGLVKYLNQLSIAGKVKTPPTNPASCGNTKAIANFFIASCYHNYMQDLAAIARLVRYYILTCTTKAGSGHPTSSLSATDLMVDLMFDKFRLGTDRLVFSKGHASPLFYSLYTAAGLLKPEELYTLRKFGSPIEGHPTPKFKYAEVASGSLGQGLSVGVGMALAAKFLDKTDAKIYVLLGDSEIAEGSNWEAMSLASHYKLDNLVGILDVNRLGQASETMHGHNVEVYRKKAEAFGWQTQVIDGHDLKQIDQTYAQVGAVKDKPLMIIAKTLKGKGVSFLEDKEGWHGKALNQEDYDKAIKELGKVEEGKIWTIKSAN